ncbi:MAG: glycosyltransferase family 2 protein, partial [Ilumatobacteraceae bacterium]
MAKAHKTPKQPEMRRQWGSDRRDHPLPTVPTRVSDRQVRLGRTAIVVTVMAWSAYVVLTIIHQFVEGKASSARLVIEALVYLVVVTALTASAIAYLITRIGFFYRSRAHRRAPRAAIDHFFTQSVPTVTVLVPSYQEDERVVRTTLLAAALQEHPDLRVVLLVDDPPEPSSGHARALLEQARSLPGKIEAQLAEPTERFQAALATFEAQRRVECAPTVDDMRTLAQHYRYAVGWLRDLAGAQEIVDHSDSFF